MFSDEGIWFMRFFLSYNMFGAMMKRLFSEVALLTIYSNYCVRVIVIFKLKRAGVEDRKICDVLGYKNVQFLRLYDRITVEEIKMMANVIDGKVIDKIIVFKTVVVVVEETSRTIFVYGQAFLVVNVVGVTFLNVIFNI